MQKVCHVFYRFNPIKHVGDSKVNYFWVAHVVMRLDKKSLFSQPHVLRFYVIQLHILPNVIPVAFAVLV